MNWRNNMITIKENVDNVEEFNYLFDKVGWEPTIMKYQRVL